MAGILLMILFGLVGIQGMYNLRCVKPPLLFTKTYFEQNFLLVYWKNIEKSVPKVICIFGDLIEQLGFRERYFWNWGTKIDQEMKKTECACFFK